MPGPKRERRKRTEEWASIKEWTLWSEQEWYEAIRPLVLFHETAGERAKEIDVPRRTLSRKADEFEQYGMQRCAVSVHMKFLHNAGGDESEPLERLTHLERKRKGENSMSGKREMEEGMYSIDSQVLCAW